jgi:putative ABC transport system permease protein
MTALFRLFSLRYLKRHKLRAFLVLTAVALGVAIFVSSSVTTTSIRASTEETARSLAGKAEWQVTRGMASGVEESLVDRIRARLPNAIAAPVLQSSAVLYEPRGNLLVLGVDFQSDAMLRLYNVVGNADTAGFAAAFVPGGIVVTRQFAERNGLKVGSSFTAGTRQGWMRLTITGLLENDGPARAMGGRLGIMELHAAQDLFGRPGFVDRIEVTGATREQLEQACPGYDITPAARRSSMVEDALARIDSLVALSVIAVLVGLFIIYNSVQISVVERLKEIGTLRAVGATRKQILAVLLVEWLIVGVVGSALGIAFGLGLARVLIGYTAGVINAIVSIINVDTVRLTPPIVAAALAVGIGATVTATLAAALGAVRTAPVDLLRPYGYRMGTRHGTAFKVGAAVVLLGAVTASLVPVSPVLGLGATALVFVGAPLMLPRIITFVGHSSRRLLQKLLGSVGFLAADNTIKFPQRTALTAATLGGALAMMVAASTVVEGFRTATMRWLDQALPFDLAVMATDFSSSLYNQQPVPPSVAEEVKRTPGVDVVYCARYLFVNVRGADVMLVAIQTEPFLEMHRRRGLSDWAAQIADARRLPALRSGEGLYMSENFAALFGVRSGESLTLSTPTGPKSFRLLKAVEDYSWPHGVLITDLAVFRRLWKDDALTYVDIFVAPGHAKADVRAAVAEKLKGRDNLFVCDKEEIKKFSEDVLRQSIAVADLQTVIAVVIGFLGIVNSLLINILQRTREIGLLRAVGMTRGQVGRTVVAEGLLVAFAAGLIGVVGGLAGAWLPLRLYTLSITGYTYPIVLPWSHVLLSFAVALAVGAVASWLPARRAANVNVLDAVGYE